MSISPEPAFKRRIREFVLHLICNGEPFGPCKCNRKKYTGAEHCFGTATPLAVDLIKEKYNVDTS